MGFTTSCFIRKNTEELRKKLEDIGYKNACSSNYHDIIYTDAEHGVYFTMFSSNIIDDEFAYDCGENEELFLAIAALRDDNNYMQWFTDGNHWEKCSDDKADIVAWESKYKTCPHKANPEEIRKKILSQKPNDKIKENMKITKEKKLNENEIIKELEFLKLTDYQKDLLHRRGIPFDCVIYERTKKKGSFLWRLTYPLFFLYIVIILIIIMPINFLITGSCFFKKNGKINKIYELWEDKIFK